MCKRATFNIGIAHGHESRYRADVRLEAVRLEAVRLEAVRPLKPDVGKGLSKFEGQSAIQAVSFVPLTVPLLSRRSAS
jgi:hypothetical protein